MSVLNIHSWDRAILHLDADAFFASCEEAKHPALKGKVVVVGLDRGIVTAVNYLGKSIGIKRGMRIFEVKKISKDAVILPSDYETYSLVSTRMFDILRSFSPDVEEYSIDEAFVDLTGLRRYYHSSYEEIAKNIQNKILKELNISVSLGISLSKVLAKIASKHKKPGGITIIKGKDIHRFLASLAIEDVWGIGKNTAALLNKFGIKTALDFAKKPEEFIKKHLSKPYYEIWQELQGKCVLPVISTPKNTYKSISKTRTFDKPTDDKLFVHSELYQNLESACFKARRYHLCAKKIILFLKGNDFKSRAVELTLSKATSYPLEISTLAEEAFNEIFNSKELYRQTGVILTELISNTHIQRSLFDDPIKIEKMERLYEAVDNIIYKYGRASLFHASTIPAKKDRLKAKTAQSPLNIGLVNIKI